VLPAGSDFCASPFSSLSGYFIRRWALPSRPIIRPHLSTMQIFLCVCQSVCMSFGHKREPYKTAEPIEVPVWVWWPKNHIANCHWSLSARFPKSGLQTHQSWCIVGFILVKSSQPDFFLFCSRAAGQNEIQYTNIHTYIQLKYTYWKFRKHCPKWILKSTGWPKKLYISTHHIFETVQDKMKRISSKCS